MSRNNWLLPFLVEFILQSISAMLKSPIMVKFLVVFVSLIILTKSLPILSLTLKIYSRPQSIIPIESLSQPFPKVTLTQTHYVLSIPWFLMSLVYCTGDVLYPMAFNVISVFLKQLHSLCTFKTCIAVISAISSCFCNHYNIKIGILFVPPF